jgi:hypothetical protein
MAIGVAEDEAKSDLCRAVADRKINIRVRIAATGRSWGGWFFSGDQVRVPTHLNPDDFDWVGSCPLGRWWIGTMVLAGWEKRPIDLIELSTVDVRDVLCGAGARGNPDMPPTVGRVSGAESVPYEPAAPKSKPGPGAKQQGITAALKALWPSGIPTGISAKDRDRQIIDWLIANQCSVPKDPARAIQRVLNKQSK